ncbi:MAG: type II toxin-antitoxin system RelE/ParE family toxin [Cyanobacteria bacterium RI_101]|nr:type II toxin-antitoxin system RelE/ParE family toxin [Cyanobacteria bacterium RI_101]
MNYSLTIKTSAVKALSQLPKQDYEKVRNAIQELAKAPRSSGCKKLKGRDGWRIRVGVYRVIYQIDDPNQSIRILNVGHRKNIYE